MTSKCFDFDEEIACNRESFELLKNFGLSTRKTESERKLKSWSSVNRVSDIFDTDSSRAGLFKDDVWDSVTKERLIGKGKCREHHRMSDTECDELLTDLSESARKIRDRFTRGFDSDIFDRRMRKVRGPPSYSSTFSNPDNSSTSSRKSSCQGNVIFPESSTASVNSDTVSEKSFGRSISINSEDSVCTEKSADCSTVFETLPDGTNKTQFENNETWLSKSNSGSICEKKVKDSTVTEKKDDRLCDKTTKKTSYLERSATGSSLQEESISERVVSCDKTGKKTVEQKTSSESYKKSYRSPKSSSAFYDEFDSCSFRRHPTCRKSLDNSGKTVSEKISNFIDEAVRQDSIFRIPSNLDEDFDRMTNEFTEEGHFGRDGREHGRKRCQDYPPSARKANETPFGRQWTERFRNPTGSEDLTQVRTQPKRWQDGRTELLARFQILLTDVAALNSQMNFMANQWMYGRIPEEAVYHLEDCIEKVKEELQTQESALKGVFRLYEENWEAERKEKEKMVREKEDLEKKVEELMTEVKSMKEDKRKPIFCGSCQGNVDKAVVFPGNTFSSANAYMPITSRTVVHVPYNMTSSSDKNFFHEEHISKKCMNDQRMNYFSTAGDSYLSKKFSECSIKTSGDTIVVEDENGIRLSITEQFPSKDGLQTKSILKKAEKKQRAMSKGYSEQTEVKKTDRSRKSSAEDRKAACAECESIGFEKDRLATVTLFTPYSIPDKAENVYTNKEFLRVGDDIRSNSEPNTRSNSSENLKPLRESSSWNNQCSSGVCPYEPYPAVPPEFPRHGHHF